MCTNCSVNYRLHAVCPPDRQQMQVTAKHIASTADETGVDKPVIPVAYTDDAGTEEDPITLMLLSKNQTLDMTMVAKKGTGKIHAKWSPVSTCIMRKRPEVTMDSELLNRTLSMDQKKEFVAKCPRKVYKLNEFKHSVEIEDADKCTLCQECTRYSQNVGLPSTCVKIGEKDTQFVFTVESTGPLEPQAIVLRSLRLL